MKIRSCSWVRWWKLNVKKWGCWPLIISVVCHRNCFQRNSRVESRRWRCFFTSLFITVTQGRQYEDAAHIKSIKTPLPYTENRAIRDLVLYTLVIYISQLFQDLWFECTASLVCLTHFIYRNLIFLIISWCIKLLFLLNVAINVS